MNDLTRSRLISYQLKSFEGYVLLKKSKFLSKPIKITFYPTHTNLNSDLDGDYLSKIMSFMIRFFCQFGHSSSLGTSDGMGLKFSPRSMLYD
mgnify:CR=1 FL=1